MTDDHCVDEALAKYMKQTPGVTHFTCDTCHTPTPLTKTRRRVPLGVEGGLGEIGGWYLVVGGWLWCGKGGVHHSRAYGSTIGWLCHHVSLPA